MNWGVFATSLSIASQYILRSALPFQDRWQGIAHQTTGSWWPTFISDSHPSDCTVSDLSEFRNTARICPVKQTRKTDEQIDRQIKMKKSLYAGKKQLKTVLAHAYIKTLNNICRRTCVLDSLIMCLYFFFCEFRLSNTRGHPFPINYLSVVAVMQPGLCSCFQSVWLTFGIVCHVILLTFPL